DSRKMWFIDSLGMKKQKASGMVNWDIGPANLLAKEFPQVVAPLGACTLVVDSLSDVIRSAPFPAVEQTLKALQTHVRETSGLYLLLANKGVHNEHVENTVKHLCDGVVDLWSESFGGDVFAGMLGVVWMHGGIWC